MISMGRDLKQHIVFVADSVFDILKRRICDCVEHRFIYLMYREWGIWVYRCIILALGGQFLIHSNGATFNKSWCGGDGFYLRNRLMVIGIVDAQWGISIHAVALFAKSRWANEQFSGRENGKASIIKIGAVPQWPRSRILAIFAKLILRGRPEAFLLYFDLVVFRGYDVGVQRIIADLICRDCHHFDCRILT